MIGGVAVAGKIVDRSEVAGRAQCVNAGSGVRCGGRSSRQERTKQEGAIRHLIDVVRAGLVDTHIADVTHRDCGIAGDLLLDGYVPLPGIGSDSARRSAAAGGVDAPDNGTAVSRGRLTPPALMENGAVLESPTCGLTRSR